MRINPVNPGFTILLGVFAGLPALSIDLSAPTLTILPAVLGTSSIVAGLTLSLFMVGFAVGQFFGGRLSDQRGRRVVLLAALVIYVFGGVCCALATNGVLLVASRFIQGVGAGSCAVQAVAMVQDHFRGEVARRKQSYVTIVLTIMPMLAPAVGALMVQQAGWRSVHEVLAVGGLLLLAITAWGVEESRAAGLRGSSGGYGFKAGLQMMTEGWFVRIVATNALSYGAIFAYIAGAPVIVMGKLGFSTYDYAALFAVTAMSLTVGAYTNTAFGRRGIGSYPVILPALSLQAVASILLALVEDGSVALKVGVAVPALMLCCFSRGIASPNLVHLAVSGHRENAGLAAAMVGLSQLMVGAAASAMVALLLPRLGFAAVALPMAFLAALAALFWRLTCRVGAPRTEPGL